MLTDAEKQICLDLMESGMSPGLIATSFAFQGVSEEKRAAIQDFCSGEKERVRLRKEQERLQRIRGAQLEKEAEAKAEAKRISLVCPHCVAPKSSMFELEPHILSEEEATFRAHFEAETDKLTASQRLFELPTRLGISPQRCADLANSLEVCKMFHKIANGEGHAASPFAFTSHFAFTHAAEVGEVRNSLYRELYKADDFEGHIARYMVA